MDVPSYMLTAHYVTNMSQINVYHQLLKASLRVMLDSCLSLLLKSTECTFQKNSQFGTHLRVEAYSQLRDITSLYKFLASQSKLIFKVATTTSRVPPVHILTNLKISNSYTTVAMIYRR